MRLTVAARKEVAIKLVESGMSQRQTAKVLGVNNATISRDLLLVELTTGILSNADWDQGFVLCAAAGTGGATIGGGGRRWDQRGSQEEGSDLHGACTGGAGGGATTTRGAGLMQAQTIAQRNLVLYRLWRRSTRAPAREGIA
jgi:hypothetical protein